MIIYFSKEAMQDDDGPRRVMKHGLLNATVAVNAATAHLPANFYDVAEVRDDGLVLRDDDDNEVFIPFADIQEVTYL